MTLNHSYLSNAEKRDFTGNKKTPIKKYPALSTRDWRPRRQTILLIFAYGAGREFKDQSAAVEISSAGNGSPDIITVFI